MDATKKAERALWEAERDTQRNITGFQLSPAADMHLRMSRNDGQWSFYLDPPRWTLFGIPVLIDPSMPPGEMKLVSDDDVVRVVNIATEDR